jgi:D-alanyl-lipoteichoic acid acyltransferase DltB (MBOAT superfamily)
MINYNFDSTTFFFNLFALSILLLPLYALLRPAWARRALFSLAGAYLLFLIAPRLMVFYVAMWVVVAGMQRIIFFTAERRFGLQFFWAILLCVLTPMVSWKIFGQPFEIQFTILTNRVIELISLPLWEIDMAREVVIPIGLSFATFRALDLLIKTFIGRLGLLSFDRVLFYGLFPPVLMVGPIIEYEEVQKQSDSKANLSAEGMLYGLFRVAFGLIKVLVLAFALAGSAAVFSNYGESELYTVWLGLFIYTWFFYLNFSGYSDIAIGFSRIFGFQLKENFNNPYFSKNIAEFWNSWHMSLSRFAQRNVFVPMGGFRSKTQCLAIYLTMMTIALWHDITLAMFAFGTYHAFGLIVHRTLSERGINILPQGTAANALRVLVTYLFVALSFPLLVMPLDRALEFYSSLVGIGSAW